MTRAWVCDGSGPGARASLGRAEPPRAGPLAVAAAHLDAHRADPAPGARARGGARLDHPAEGRRLPQDRQLAGPAPEADADLREARAVRGLRLAVVLGDLHPAGDLAARLHRAADLG